MTDTEEPVHGEGRPDTSQDDRREDGLAIFKRNEREAAERDHRPDAEEAQAPPRQQSRDHAP